MDGGYGLVLAEEHYVTPTVPVGGLPVTVTGSCPGHENASSAAGPSVKGRFGEPFWRSVGRGRDFLSLALGYWLLKIVGKFLSYKEKVRNLGIPAKAFIFNRKENRRFQMAEICCGVVSESKASEPCEPNSRAARRRRMEIRRIKYVAPVPEAVCAKRQKIERSSPATSPRECENAVESTLGGNAKPCEKGIGGARGKLNISSGSSSLEEELSALERRPKFGVTSICGRRRDMEDAVSIHPSFCQAERQSPATLDFFGVYDGHGCSHVAMSCKRRLHDLVAEEIRAREASGEWKEPMKRSFWRMDKEVIGAGASPLATNCRCELQTPQCDAVGSTAVVAVVSPDEIVVANCGDSRAVLCRNGKAIPLSSDHKPDRPDELLRIQAAGGRVIYWDGARVLGVLAMSRAMGDNYLKPYVSSEPEVTVMQRSPDDDCLILASDGLWDVVSNDTACGIVRMCLRGQPPSSPRNGAGGNGSDKACSDASMLLTKLALARRSTDNVSVIVVDLRKDT